MNYLEELAKGYLHQDYDIYGGDVWDALQAFLDDNGGRAAAVGLTREIDELFRRTANDDGRVAAELLALGIQVGPTSEEETFTQFLQGIRKRAIRVASD
ncbi:contact-dependent growth inhibition system immunity protein [Williamsia sterculiae]|uniref:CdiI immunity protein domain-containing protein n=1 Tax=Williamsia sterculiae TaxID=1344003 RepID=A0A1N7HB67_9NOCA|nr:contact-dependent growth inhibition system immunity protein [Williamsia sterculiae]SIS22023.1 hypothetical protein SAMN05445060_3870 [Williamsia sterculiae]